MALEVELAVETGSDSRRVFLTANTEEIRITTIDIGDVPRMIFGRKEYEQMLMINKEHYPQLLFVLLEEKDTGRPNSLRELLELCGAKGIPTDRFDWHSD